MNGVYLDYQASTPLDPRVAHIMRPFLDQEIGNPHSTDHAFGRAAALTIDHARQQVAAAIGARPAEILFTSGATEANNTALKGLGQVAHIIVAATEHACVLNTAQLADQCTILPVDRQGIIDPDQVQNAITPETNIVSIMLVNNEIGVIQPIAEIAAICRERRVLLHCDAAQALGRVPVRVHDLGVDLLSLSSHKIYGPKGVGALFIRRGVSVSPLLHGGGQERNMRSGTLAPMLCAGFGAAAQIADQERDADQARFQQLTASLLGLLKVSRINFSVNGSKDQRIADNLNLHFPLIDQSNLMHRLGDVAVSSASACSGSAGKTSHVLAALGHDPALQAANIRLCVGRETTMNDIEYAAQKIIAAVT